jgi:hypothetical protein
MVLGERVAEEVEIVRDILAKAYQRFLFLRRNFARKSFGDCALHNQTITITTVNETE